MTKRHQFVVACIILGSLVYVIILQASLMRKSLPTEPPTPEFRKICSTSYARNSNSIIKEPYNSYDLPTIYVVTPTYQRPERIAELTRLGQTLLLVPNIHWIVADDSSSCSQVVYQFLIQLGLPFTHIVSPMPEIYRKLTYGPRGVSNRRAALQWVREHASDNGILYFLDDDNAIDIRLFEEMRSTKKVSMFPVGLIGKYAVSSPVVNQEGVVTGFFDAWPAGRKFQVDMAGFAVNVGFLKSQKQVSMPYAPGHEEDGFLKSLHISLSDIEVKAKSCSEILVWHTRTVKNRIQTVSVAGHIKDNINVLLKRMRSLGLINLV